MKMQERLIRSTVNGLNSPNTRKSYRWALEMFLKWCQENDDPDIDVLSINDFKAYVMDHYSFATVNQAVHAIKKMIEIHMSISQPQLASAILMFVKPIPYKQVKAEITYTQDQLDRLLGLCGDDKYGVRDAAMISVIFGAGLRRSEVVGLRLNDYDPERGLLVVRSGKGRKGRVSALPDWAVERLNEWLVIRYAVPSCKALFVPCKGKEPATRGISSDNLYRAFCARFREAGLPHTHPHDGRANFVTTMLRSKIDPLIIALQVGHSNIATTQAYDRRGTDDLLEAIRAIDKSEG